MCILQPCPFTSKLWHHHMGINIQIHLEKLSSLQNKAIRDVGGAEWNESSSSLYYKIS